MQSLNKEGYAVIGLNAKDYFWNKKKPQEAAIAIEEAINGSNKEWKRKSIVLIGYSFGEATAAIAGAQTTGGSTTITLSDNTKITFTGVTDPAALTGHIG